MQCPQCQQHTPTGQKFCGECGAPLKGADRSPYSSPSYTELQRSLTAALEQQTATADILRVISRSPTDTQPVFDAIAESAARLCSANDAQVLRVEGDILRLVAAYGATSMPSVRQLTRGHLVGRSVIDRRTIHVRDLAQALAEYPETTAPRYGVQSALAVPLLRDGAALGVIRISRTEIRPFTDKQIALLQTFADQAVIAIENVRLFTETKEALEQQTATSEILRVISSSPTDVQPVFDAIAESAVRLCNAEVSVVTRFDGTALQLTAVHGVSERGVEAVRSDYPMPIDGRSLSARAVRHRDVVHVADVMADPEYGIKDTAVAAGWRGALAVPMWRDRQIAGVIFVGRAAPGLFGNSQVELLKTFADQAVIAIENVRLFTELQTSNRDLTRALDTQTATSDILRVISRSQTDVHPVFDVIVESAVRLLRGFVAALSRLAGDQLELAAFTSTDPAGDAAVRSAFPQTLASDWPHSRVVRKRGLLNVTDARNDPQLPEAIRNVAVVRGYQSLVVLPMLRRDEAIGAISVTRREPGGFTDDEIALLQTFADQAVIAIENVRLFKELEAANRELAAASQHKSEFLANMSHELRTPLNAIIGFSEVLSERMFGDLNEKQEEYSKDIHASGQHLLALINDILDLSKIEAGRMELELTDFDLPTALDNALMLVRERAQRRSLTLHKNVDAEVGQIQGDERKIRQVVLNLLSNAIKFTPEGGRIELAAVPEGGLVQVSIRDTGVGIAAEDHEKVFEEFRQVGTADKKAEGTGLGLTLCRKFIELHGGMIWVKSQLGVGSTFTFTIPVRQGA
jgi:signal transduction histidine kinase